MAKQELSNDLLGRRAKPLKDTKHLWKAEANLSGELVGEILAAWVDSDHHVMVLIKGPMGDAFEAWATHVEIGSKT